MGGLAIGGNKSYQMGWKHCDMYCIARNFAMDHQFSEMMGCRPIGFHNVWKSRHGIEAIDDRRGDLRDPILARYQRIQGVCGERSYVRDVAEIAHPYQPRVPETAIQRRVVELGGVGGMSTAPDITKPTQKEYGSM